MSEFISLVEAFKICHGERIDHGVRSIEQPEQVRYLGKFDRIAADLS
jgi:adenosine deaminase